MAWPHSCLFHFRHLLGQSLTFRCAGREWGEHSLTGLCGGAGCERPVVAYQLWLCTACRATLAGCAQLTWPCLVGSSAASPTASTLA
jgi:hypothetical protein